MKAKIFVNRHKVRENKKHGLDQPCIGIRTYKGSTYAKHLKLLGSDWELIQDFENPMCSGATLWLEGQFENVEVLQ